MFDLRNKEGYKNFGTRLKEARLKKGYTQEKTAEHIGVSRSTYALWETGEHMPEYDTLSVICNELAIDLGYLMGDYTERLYNINQISKITGLSEVAIKNLHSMYDNPPFDMRTGHFADKGDIKPINEILERIPYDLLLFCQRLISISNNQVIIDNNSSWDDVSRDKISVQRAKKRTSISWQEYDDLKIEQEKELFSLNQFVRNMINLLSEKLNEKTIK